MTQKPDSGWVEELRALVGQTGPTGTARDEVNAAMIRHWCDAMTDHNPVYTDPGFAEKSIHAGIVAPPAMLNAWLMPGNVPRVADADSPSSHVLSRLDAAGFTSVVATNSEHEYERYLRLGEVLMSRQILSDISDEKQTGLGIGHFVTTRSEYRDAAGELVGRMKFRILKFKPDTGRARPDAAQSSDHPRPVRPRPGISRDTRFFWEGIEAGELRIQKCEACDRLFHPPVVRCSVCGSYGLGWIVSSGRGHVYSFVEPCHPKLDSFDYPYIVGLVELEEGTRLLTNIVDLEPDKVEIGLPVELAIRRSDPELALPMFRPQRPPRRERTLGFEEIEPGQELPPCPVPISATLIVAGAIASRDYQDVHHDSELAKLRGSPDIFMNILTTGGLCGRYLTDWTGPEALLRSLRIRLGAPNYPHDTMTLCGSVTAKKRDRGHACIEVQLRGYNRLGDHVTGTAEIELPERSEPKGAR